MLLGFVCDSRRSPGTRSSNGLVLIRRAPAWTGAAPLDSEDPRAAMGFFRGTYGETQPFVFVRCVVCVLRGGGLKKTHPYGPYIHIYV